MDRYDSGWSHYTKWIAPCYFLLLNSGREWKFFFSFYVMYDLRWEINELTTDLEDNVHLILKPIKPTTGNLHQNQSPCITRYELLICFPQYTRFSIVITMLDIEMGELSEHVLSNTRVKCAGLKVDRQSRSSVLREHQHHLIRIILYPCVLPQCAHLHGYFIACQV